MRVITCMWQALAYTAADVYRQGAASMPPCVCMQAWLQGTNLQHVASFSCIAIRSYRTAICISHSVGTECLLKQQQHTLQFLQASIRHSSACLQGRQPALRCSSF